MRPGVGASTSWQSLAEMELVYARSRRRAARRRAEPKKRSALDWRTVRAVVLAIALLGFVTEGSRLVETAPAKSTAASEFPAVARACGIPRAYAGAFGEA